ncbi:MAG: F0F1 ATP synthase subunit B [Candidatus Latescibacterota bacterium]
MLLEPHAGTIVWTIITFLVVMAILKATVWKPLLAALDAREQRIADALEGARRARAEAEATLVEHRRRLDQAEEEARRLLREARESADKVRQEVVERARGEAQAAVEQARRSIESEKRTAIVELRREVADLAVQAAGAILDANLDGERSRRLVDQVIARVPLSQDEAP